MKTDHTPTDAIEAIRRLRLLMTKHGWKQQAVAEKIGCTQATVSRWLKKEPIWFPDRDHCALINQLYSKMEGVRGDVSTTTPQAATIGSQQSNAETHLERTDANTLSDTRTSSDESWTLPKSIAERLGYPTAMKSIKVVGDSMEPTIKNGSTVFIDTASIHPSPDDIYAVNWGDGIVVKRVQLIPNSDRLLIISDNKSRYENHVEILRSDVKVHGRVIASFASLSS